MRRRLTAWIALAAFLGSLGLPVLPDSHAWGDPDTGWLEGHPVTQIESVKAPAGGEHCAICHWLRDLGHSVAGSRPAVHVLLFAGTRVPSARVAAAGVTAAGGPARAPPVASLG